MAQPCVKDSDKRTLAEHMGRTKLQVPGRSDRQVFTYFVRYQPPLYAGHVLAPFGGVRIVCRAPSLHSADLETWTYFQHKAEHKGNTRGIIRNKSTTIGIEKKAPNMASHSSR